VRRPPVVLGMAAITILALLVAVALILFSVNPTQKTNQDQIKKTQAEIEKTVMSQHAIICAQVQNTANSYRFRSLTPSGQVEPIRHFLTRMQAQQQTLRLARGSECRSAPGFPPVGLQVRRALGQIHRILQSFEPRLRRPVAQRQIPHNPSFRHPGFSPAYSAPSNAGVGEEGVPATLKQDLGSQTPPGGSGGHPGPHKEGAPPPLNPQPPESAPSPPEATPVAPAPSQPGKGGRIEVPGLVEGEVEFSLPETVWNTESSLEINVKPGGSE
jgi:hypothetical protein